MIALLQRVTWGKVEIDDDTVAKIGTGIVALIGVEKGDQEKNAERLLRRLLGYRIFPDDQGRMNLSLTDINAELLLVPQFTLAADTKKGMRPSFTPAAAPAEGEKLYRHLVERAMASHSIVETGRFGADMQISLTNDGPVTFWLQG